MKINQVHIASQLFDELSWKKGNETFESFCTLLSNLNQQESQLVIELTKKFIKVDWEHYFMHLLTSFNKLMISDFFNRYDSFYFSQLKQKKYDNLTKSSDLLYQALNGFNFFRENNLFKGKQYSLQSISQLRNWEVGKDIGIILIDDYIGTGKTASDALDEMKAPREQIAIVCINAHSLAIEKFKNSVPIFWSRTSKKMIDEEYSEPEATLKRNIMHGIEKRIPNMNRENSLGYNNSQDLIRMLRTPNNTFPVYWEYSDLLYGNLKPVFPRD